MAIAAAAPLARVALARSPVRMLAPATVVLLIGAAVLALGAVVGALMGDGPPSIALLVGGAVAIAIGLWLGARVMTLRLLIEPGYLHLRGLGTDRRFQLARGQLRRLPTAGPAKVSLAVRLGSLGWTVGRAKLPSGERVHVIRLGATPSVILVPTEQGRVALAVASEANFVDALVAAARTRAERPPVAPAAALPVATVAAAALPAALEAIRPAAAMLADMPVPPPTAALSTRSAVAARPAPSPAIPPRAPRPEPSRARPLTGIERMWLEDRLARERRAALAGAREEQAAASFTASVAALTPAGARVVPTAPAPPPAVPAAAVSTPVASAMAAASALAAAPTLATAPAAAAASATSAAALPTVIPRRRPRRPMARRVTWPEVPPGVVLVTAPLLGALVSWLLAVVLGAAPGSPGTDPMTAALLLCGPVGALAVYLAYSRWPRLAGLSSVSAMVALLLVARALIG